METKVPWIFVAAALLVALVAGSVLFVFLLIGYSGLFLNLTSSQPSDYKVKFGMVSVDANGYGTLSKETTVLPLRYKDSGFRYGIEIVPPNDQPYSYHCIFHFPSAPKIVTGEYFEGKDPSATIRTKEMQVSGGTITDENWFDPGDPSGDESMDVYINGKLVVTFKYTVVPDN